MKRKIVGMITLAFLVIIVALTATKEYATRRNNSLDLSNSGQSNPSSTRDGLIKKPIASRAEENKLYQNLKKEDDSMKVALNSLNLQPQEAWADDIKTIKSIEANRALEAKKIQKDLAGPSSSEDKSLAGVLILKGKNGQQELTPLIRIAHDLNAEITSNAENLENELSLSNYSFRIGVWDSGSIRITHQEIRGKSSIMDGSALSDHATKVAGVIAARGITNAAKGLASKIEIRSFDWNSDVSELLTHGSATATATNKLPVSNHSYNFSSGWYKSGTNYIFSGSSSLGQYNSSVQEVDQLLYNLPYSLMVRSAGNDRTDNPREGEMVRLDYWSSTMTAYNSSIHPLGDGVQKGGFNTISYAAIAKNVLTVGAVNDAVTSGKRDLAKATMTSYSAWGPADDGRIKPDLVANGSSLYTIASLNDTSYATLNGTSAAAPVVSAISSILTQKWVSLCTTSTTAMQSSTLKAILIHGSDDLGETGPDYKFGWGLANAKASASIIDLHFSNPELSVVKEEAINNSNAVTNSYSWDGVNPIKVTLCWTDPAGTPVTNNDDQTPCLVNDLDVRIICPDGQILYPYTMPFTTIRSQSSMSLPATTGDNTVDNVEVIELKAPMLGSYKVVVSKKPNLNTVQKYSLVATGFSQEQTPPPPSPYSLWAQTNFGAEWESVPTATPEEDFDADGLVNWVEFRANTSPTNADSVIKAQIQSISTTNQATQIVVRIAPLSAKGVTKLLSTSNLEEKVWSGPEVILPKEDKEFEEVQITSTQPHLFFRVAFTPDPI
jgi:hypothetical protein